MGKQSRKRREKRKLQETGEEQARFNAMLKRFAVGGISAIQVSRTPVSEQQKQPIPEALANA